MKVKIVNHSPYPSPFYATPLSAGMDLRAAITEPVVLKPLQRAMVPTGLYIALPEGYEAQVRPRSGLAAKKGITEEEAKKVIREIDTTRENYIKKFTGSTRYDTRNYDLVINMNGRSEDVIADMIMMYIGE